jgi:hypothetical protein
VFTMSGCPVTGERFFQHLDSVRASSVMVTH